MSCITHFSVPIFLGPCIVFFNNPWRPNFLSNPYSIFWPWYLLLRIRRIWQASSSLIWHRELSTRMLSLVATQSWLECLCWTPPVFALLEFWNTAVKPKVPFFQQGFGCHVWVIVSPQLGSIFVAWHFSLNLSNICLGEQRNLFWVWRVSPPSFPNALSFSFSVARPAPLPPTLPIFLSYLNLFPLPKGTCE